MIKYKTRPSKAKEISLVLDLVGIEYELTYIPDTVPCQTKTMIIMKPKNELERLACIGVCG